MKRNAQKPKKVIAKNSSSRRPGKKASSYVFITLLFIGLVIGIFALQHQQKLRSNAAQVIVNADQTDRTNLSFTANGYTSEYHLYAGGLDWTKTVGLLIYADGSGEYGLKNPNQDYLMAGANGMIAVAKKHNMILLTPLSPNKACEDGDGSCWYQGDTAGYTKWAEMLVASIESQYPIDKKRVAFGGYSSGAELAMSLWTPSGAAQRTMDDGVIVAISYGDPPFGGNVAQFASAFKSAVHLNWNVGDADTSAYNAAKKGQAYYAKEGFQTTIDVLPGVTHDRSKQFGGIMDAQITKHVPPATAAGATGNPSPSTNTSPLPTGVSPTYVCGGSNACVPTGSVTPTLFVTPNVSANPSIDPAVTEFPPQTSITQTPSGFPPFPSVGPGNGGGGGGANGGFFQMILQFLLGLLMMFLSMFR